MKFLLIFLFSFLVIPGFATPNQNVSEDTRDELHNEIMTNFTSQNFSHSTKILDLEGAQLLQL